MQVCSIYDRSLKFSRALYAILVLAAFFLHNKWLVLFVAIATILGAFSVKLNLPYQIHAMLTKKNYTPIQKDSGELNFVSGATGFLLLIGFLLLQYTQMTNFAWIYILVVDMMIFLACLVGFCVATLMYVTFKRLFSKQTNV